MGLAEGWQCRGWSCGGGPDSRSRGGRRGRLLQHPIDTWPLGGGEPKLLVAARSTLLPDPGESRCPRDDPAGDPTNYRLGGGNDAGRRGAAEQTGRKLRARSLVPNAAFLVSVKSLIELARSKQDVLVQQGLKPEVLDELDVKVAEFEAAAEAARTGRRNHIGAGAEMEQVLVELRKEIKLADGITRYRFGMDPDTMKEWKAVRRLPARARPDGGVKPQQSSGEAPAA